MTSFPVSLSAEEMSNSPKPRYLQFKRSLKRFEETHCHRCIIPVRESRKQRETQNKHVTAAQYYFGGNHLLNYFMQIRLELNV